MKVNIICHQHQLFFFLLPFGYYAFKVTYIFLEPPNDSSTATYFLKLFLSIICPVLILVILVLIVILFMRHLNKHRMPAITVHEVDPFFNLHDGLRVTPAGDSTLRVSVNVNSDIFCRQMKIFEHFLINHLQLTVVRGYTVVKKEVETDLGLNFCSLTLK